MARIKQKPRDSRDEQPAAGLTVGQLRELVRDVVQTELAAFLEDRPRPDALIDVTGLAKHLGVTARTIHNLRKEGLPTVMVMQSPRFELSAVVMWLRATRAKPNDLRDAMLAAAEASLLRYVPEPYKPE